MVNKKRSLRIGVLGCGKVAQIAHFDACKKANNVELYAICDKEKDLLEAMSTRNNPCVVYDNYDDMLLDTQLDAVIVATADHLHVPLSIQALDAGKHVLVEKPMGITVEECELLQDKVNQSGLTLQVGYMKHFDPGIAFAHKFINQELGQKMAMKLWYCDSTYRYTMEETLWPTLLTADPDGAGSVSQDVDKRAYKLVAHGSHLVDTAALLGGRIESVTAKLVEKFGSYCWFVSIDYADGSLGHIDLIISIRGDWEEGFQIYGEHGSVTGKTYLPWYHKSSRVECFSARDGQYRRVLGENAHAYKLQLESFADTILNGVPQIGANAADGVEATRALVAISRSVQQNTTVSLSDVVGSV